MLPPSVPALRIGEARVVLHDHGNRIAQRNGAADLDMRSRFAELAELGDTTRVDHGVEFSMLFRDPQPDVGAAGENRRIGIACAEFGERRDVERRKETPPGVFQGQRSAARNALETRDALLRSCALAARLPQPAGLLVGFAVHGPGRRNDRPVARATAEVAGKRVVDLLPRRVRIRLVQREQRHDESGRAEPALRRVFPYQGRLYRVQVARGRRETLDGNEFLAVECRQELDTGIDGAQHQVIAVPADLGDDDGARTAVAFGATFLRALAPQVFAQELQDRSRWIDITQLDDLTVEHKAN